MPDSIDRGHIRGSPAGGHVSNHGHLPMRASMHVDQAEFATPTGGVVI